MITEKTVPTNIDFDQLSKWGQKPYLDCSPIKTDFEAQIHAIGGILDDQYGTPEMAIRLLCDVIKDLKKQIDDLENKQKQNNFPEFH